MDEFNVAQRGLLVALKISAPSGTKTDRAVSSEVDKRHNATGAGLYSKRLINSTYISTYRQVTTAARRFHEEVTLPWMDGGFRILPTKLALEYKAEMGKFQSAAHSQVEKLIRLYPEEIEAAKKRLGSLFNPGDFPSKEEFARKFGIHYRMMPLPEISSDWRIDLSEGEVRVLRESMQLEYTDALQNVVEDVGGRLEEFLKHLHNRLSDPDKIIRTEMQEKAVELSELLPKLNITGDPELGKRITEFQNSFASLNIENARLDNRYRSSKAKEAEAILKSMGLSC